MFGKNMVMNITEAIKVLEKIKAEHGDLRITRPKPDYVATVAEDITPTVDFIFKKFNSYSEEKDENEKVVRL